MQKVRKTTQSERMKTGNWYLIICKIYFFSNIKILFEYIRYVLEKITIYLITTHWSCFKYNNLNQTLNVYKIPAKEHQVIDTWNAHEISVS